MKIWKHNLDEAKEEIQDVLFLYFLNVNVKSIVFLKRGTSY